MKYLILTMGVLLCGYSQEALGDERMFLYDVSIDLKYKEDFYDIKDDVNFAKLYKHLIDSKKYVKPRFALYELTHIKNDALKTIFFYMYSWNLKRINRAKLYSYRVIYSKYNKADDILFAPDNFKNICKLKQTVLSYNLTYTKKLGIYIT